MTQLFFTEEETVAMTELHWQIVEVCEKSGLDIGHATVACLLSATSLNRTSKRLTHEGIIDILRSIEDIPDDALGYLGDDMEASND